MSDQATGSAPSVDKLLTGPTSVVTAGVDIFDDALAAQGVHVDAVDWRPAVDGTTDDVNAVARDRRREEANRRALDAMKAAGAVLTDVRPASDALGLRPGTFLHAGPPIEFERASGPLTGALIGAMIFEGLAGSAEHAQAQLTAGALDSGEPIVLEPCHHHSAVGPMAGVISPSMWLFELTDPSSSRRAYSSLNEGLGKVLRYGAYGDEVIERLNWLRDTVGPLLARAVRRRAESDAGPIDVRNISAQMLQMGDEGHNRNRAGTMMFVRELIPELLDLGADAADVAAVVRFANTNDHFYLNLVMPQCKLTTDAGRDVPGSTIVVAMARNGTDFGIQVSGTGDTWFTGPAQVADGLFLGNYGPDDANPDIGDSAITETAGMGGFAMAAAPAIVAFVGGDENTARDTTSRMYQITADEHPVLQIPSMGFRGVPFGIDVLQVVKSGILPQINTGIAGRVAGTGQVGAGLVNPPMDCFTGAIRALSAAAEQ
ncbi:YlbE family protein [Spelaeicoccus albus]|uniref:DUF1116 domain-containing protein n=1 Tax=Spelaeicoccus albus TaxID=1280376 RepID=A0A7Z0D467_9MICO|nr:DUF1116 domain-containing protein [Spelaeicoccus albus]NYI68546.1 hypothetical protein [Spelaeicoccus albus]